MLSEWLKRAIAALARTLLRLRYRLEISGLDDVTQKGHTGILFLPNHSALVDPVILVSLLYRPFAPRPLADEHQVTRTAFGKVALFFGARTLPNLERSGAVARDRMRLAVAGLVEDLKAGRNVLMYPAGRLKRGYLEDLGSMSATETILKALPDARVVLVRHNGLWGSSFSLAFSGRMPDFGPALVRGVKGVLASGLFFAPRRRVTLEFVEPTDLPRAASRSEINRYLEAFYNARASKNTYVPYSRWEGGGTREMPEPTYRTSVVDVSDVAPATVQLVLGHLREESGREDLDPALLLGHDLGMDSLATAELVAWVEQEFGFSVGTPESLRTVADVIAAAAGRGLSSAPADIPPVPPVWFSGRDRARLVSVPAGTTITGAFLERARTNPGQPAVADLTSGIRTYRDLVTAILVLKPHLEAIPGPYLGIMLPASVGASVFFFASLFAGKTAVMVNWTTGVRTIRHSLESLGVTRVVTARALLAKLTTLGIDMSDIEDRFLFVEDLLGDLSLLDKLKAALRSRTTWATLAAATPPEHAVVLFTSGSESLPKAVPLTHDNLLTNARDILNHGDVAESDAVVGMLPPFHSFGLTTTVVLPVLAGVRTVYYPNPTESAVLARVVHAYRASVLFATPTFLGGIVRVADHGQLDSMRLVVLGAERCPDALHAAARHVMPQALLLEGYGITECSPVVSCSPVAAPRPGTIGTLLHHLEAAIVDLGLTRRVPVGETGLLLVRGPSVFPGYLNHEGESPFVEFEGRSWYRTGDLIHAMSDGVLHFDGRLKRFVKLGGEMVSLPAIESVILQAFGRVESEPSLAVEAIGDPDAPDIVLFATVAVERAAANAAIREAGLSALHHIRQVVPVDAIPLLGTGKTDYRALKARYAETHGGR